jgi:hypothetical protein
MRKLPILLALVVACIVPSFGEAFPDLVCESVLDGGAMAAIDGEQITIWAQGNCGGMATVMTRERGDYCQFTVPVTTMAISCNPNNPPRDKNGNIYSPVPLPAGCYNLGYSQNMSNPTYGVGISISADISTPYRNGSGCFTASDFFIHQTPYGNTWGCVGVQASSTKTASQNMNTVINAYAASTGSKKLYIK